MTQLDLEQVKKLASNPVDAAESAVALIECLSCDDEEIRAWTSDALQAIEQVPDVLGSTLAERTMHALGPVASWSCRLLGKLGPAATGYQAALARALNEHENLGVKQQAVVALSHIPTLDATTIKAVEQAAEHADPRLSRLAKQTLEKLTAA